MLDVLLEDGLCAAIIDLAVLVIFALTLVGVPWYVLFGDRENHDDWT